MHPFARQYTGLAFDSTTSRHRRRLRVEYLEEIAAANSLQDLLLIGSPGEVGTVAPAPPATSDTGESPEPTVAALQPAPDPEAVPPPSPSAKPAAPIDDASGDALPPNIGVDLAEADLWLIGSDESGDRDLADLPGTPSTAGATGGSNAGEPSSGPTVNDPATFDAAPTPVSDTSIASPNRDLSVPPHTTAPPTSKAPGPGEPARGGDRISIRSAAADATITLDANGDSLENVFATPAPATSAPGVVLPYGLIGFRVTDVELGGIATVDLTLPTGAAVDGYYKQDPETQSLSRFDFDGETGAIINGSTVTLYLRDGGRGDDDGVINGVVVDPGGPGYEVIMSATVREVTVSGPDLINIVADPGTPAYPSPPHWLDTNLNGTIDLNGERALPVGYPRDRNAVVSARFTATISNVPVPDAPEPHGAGPQHPVGNTAV